MQRIDDALYCFFKKIFLKVPFYYWATRWPNWNEFIGINGSKKCIDANSLIYACMYIYRIYIYTYTGAGHIIRISSKSWFISLIPFKKWNLYNVYIHSTQTDIIQVFISFNFDDYNWQLMKTPNSVSQKIIILLNW